MSSYGHLGRFSIHNTLGAGANAKVKLAEDPLSGTQIAVKIMKGDASSISREFLAQCKSEVEALSRIDHPNVVRVIEVGESAVYESKKGNTRTVFYIAMDYLPNSELHHVLYYTGKFEEPLARTYFHQMMSAVAACHAKGIAHRDLKPENVLFDREFNLKLSDFGFAAPVEGRDGQGFLSTFVGTVTHMAPEILRREAYSGAAVDIFACGIILFLMISGSPIFGSATLSDALFNTFKNEKERFWKMHSKNKPVGFYSPEFQSLINSMLAFEPEERPSAAQVLQHPWTTGFSTPFPEAKVIIARRHAIALLKQRQEDAINLQKAQRKLLGRQTKPSDGHYLGDMGESSDLPGYALSPLKETASGRCAWIYTRLKAVQAFAAVTGFFASKNSEVHLSEGKYRLRSTVETGEGGCVGLTVELFAVGDGRVCVELTKRDGGTWEFLNLFEEMRRDVEREAELYTDADESNA